MSKRAFNAAPRKPPPPPPPRPADLTQFYYSQPNRCACGGIAHVGIKQPDGTHKWQCARCAPDLSEILGFEL